MKNNSKFIIVILIIFLSISCKEKATYSKIETTSSTAKTTIHEILIKETLDAGVYMYLNVEENGKYFWMAVPNSDIKVGEVYYFDGGMVMKDFESKQLNKTFDFITFAEGVRKTKEPVMVAKKDKHVHKAAPATVEAKIEQPEGGTSLALLFSKKKDFSKKEVLVKGKVIKVNNGIMNKNWVHIIDGTQFEDEKSLTITTQEEVKVGDIVTFKGVIVLEKDFGAGYIYDTLLEEGKVIK